eukprot:6957692-Prymnesium_polylepis.1
MVKPVKPAQRPNHTRDQRLLRAQTEFTVSHPQSRTRASLTEAYMYAPTQPNSPSATASHQRSSLESSAVPCAMHMCSSRKDTARTARQTAHAPRPRISIAASSRAQ